jgi:hypothetical protein
MQSQMHTKPTISRVATLLEATCIGLRVLSEALPPATSPVRRGERMCHAQERNERRCAAVRVADARREHETISAADLQSQPVGSSGRA